MNYDSKKKPFHLSDLDKRRLKKELENADEEILASSPSEEYVRAYSEYADKMNDYLQKRKALDRKWRKTYETFIKIDFRKDPEGYKQLKRQLDDLRDQYDVLREKGMPKHPASNEQE